MTTEPTMVEDRPTLTMKPEEARVVSSQSPFMNGRKVLYSKEKEVTRANLVTILKEVESRHTQNMVDIDYLYHYEKGNQPILSRSKEVRPEINNQIVENRAHEIIQFKNGYQFGSGGFYVRRSSTTEKLDALNEQMATISKDANDIELGFWIFLSGIGYRMVLPGQDENEPIEMVVLDPRYTAQVNTRGLRKTHLLSFTFVKRNDGTKRYYGYTKDYYFEVEKDKVDVWKKHGLPQIPIVEYIANPTRTGAFERVLGLLDALNLLQSDRLNAVNQFVQAFLKLKNVNLEDEDIARIGELGAIKFTSPPGVDADVDLIAKEMNQGQNQTLKDDMYQSILVICAMPDRQGTNRSSGDTGTAVELRDGWANAETSAKEVEMLFKRSEKRVIELVSHYLNTYDKEANLDPSKIDIKFLRSPRNDQVSASQAMLNQAQMGIHPKHIIANSNLYGDPEQVYEDSKEYLKKWENEQAEQVAQPVEVPQNPEIVDVQSQPLHNED